MNKENVLDLFKSFIENHSKRPKACNLISEEKCLQSPEFIAWYKKQVEIFNTLSEKVLNGDLLDIEVSIRVELRLKLVEIGRLLLKIHYELELVDIKLPEINKSLLGTPTSTPPPSVVTLSELGVTKEEFIRRVSSLIKFNRFLLSLTQDELQDKRLNMELQKQRLKYNTLRRICLNSGIKPENIPEIPEIPYPKTN